MDAKITALKKSSVTVDEKITIAIGLWEGTEYIPNKSVFILDFITQTLGAKQKTKDNIRNARLWLFFFEFSKIESEKKTLEGLAHSATSINQIFVNGLATYLEDMKFNDSMDIDGVVKSFGLDVILDTISIFIKASPETLRINIESLLTTFKLLLQLISASGFEECSSVQLCASELITLLQISIQHSSNSKRLFTLFLQNGFKESIEILGMHKRMKIQSDLLAPLCLLLRNILFDKEILQEFQSYFLTIKLEVTDHSDQKSYVKLFFTKLFEILSIDTNHIALYGIPYLFEFLLESTKLHKIKDTDGFSFSIFAFFTNMIRGALDQHEGSSWLLLQPLTELCSLCKVFKVFQLTNTNSNIHFDFLQTLFKEMKIRAINPTSNLFLNESFYI